MSRSRKHQLWWTDQALEDLEQLGKAPPRARAKIASLARKIRERVLSLRDFPLSGRLVPEFEQQAYRELIVAPYRIVYEVRDQKVIILRVWHGRRDLHAENLPDEPFE